MGSKTGLRRLLVTLLVLVGAAVLIWATAGPPPPEPTPEGAFAFAVLGDAPYYPWEELRFRLVRQALDEHQLAFVVHVGDTLWRPCSDRQFRKVLGWLEALRHPVILTPGDNDWTDCWEPQVGEFQPLERLARLRELFFAEPERALGGGGLGLESQAASGAGEEFPENVRWQWRGVLFATIHLVGSANGRQPFPGRTFADDAEADRREAAGVAWLQAAFDAAEEDGAAALVLAFHAAPPFEEPVGHPWRRGYEPFLAALEERAARFGRPVLLAHGDDHQFRVDRPLVHRGTGRRLDNVTRLEVPGSPDVGWVRVLVHAGSEPRFSFQEKLVPRWKYW